jgi:Lrp/AsnC family transcriptional regulator for asnA, asnC and gidA
MEDTFHIDNLDKKILSIIQDNARVPFLEVARECGVSGAAIHQRVQKLVKMGVIVGSEFIVDPKKIGYHTCAYIGIFLEKAGFYSEVVNELMKIPEIIQCDYTTGNWSIFIKVYTRDNEHLKVILADKLQSINGVARTETFICLEESFNRHLQVV